MERVVNIIGLGESATTTPDHGENWVLNCAYKKVKRVDKMFFMDDFSIIKNEDVTLPPYDYLLKDCIKENPDIEIISRFESLIKDIKGNDLAPIKPYPLNEAIKLAPGGFFTSTIAYAVCYAILEKVDRIRLYGMEVWTGSDANEYMYQKPCLDFWLAFAMGRGIKVEIPYHVMLTCQNKQNYYGYIKGELSQNRLRG